MGNRWLCMGSVVEHGYRWLCMGNLWLCMGNRWLSMGNRWLSMGNRWLCMGNRWLCIGNQWLCMGNRGGLRGHLTFWTNKRHFVFCLLFVLLVFFFWCWVFFFVFFVFFVFAPFSVSLLLFQSECVLRFDSRYSGHTIEFGKRRQGIVRMRWPVVQEGGWGGSMTVSRTFREVTDCLVILMLLYRRKWPNIYTYWGQK